MGLSITICGMHYAPEHTGNAPYTAGLAAGLVARGHRVRVVTGFPHYPAWKVDDAAWRRVEKLDGVDVVRVRHYVPSNPTNLRRAFYELTYGVRSVLARWGRPDVVVAVSPTLLSAAMEVTRARLGRRRPALGVHVHDLYSLGVVENLESSSAVERAFTAIESAVLRHADGVSVVHDRYRRVLSDQLGIDPAAVTVNRNWTHITPVTDVDRPAVRARHGWGDEVVVLHAGNMGAKQGLGNVVAAARLADVRQAPVRFVMLGGGNQRAELEREAAGVERITFVDSLPERDFVEAMAAADVLLVNEKPGMSESAVPSKLTSYFATGNAVLGAVDARGAAATEIEASGGGVVVPAGDPEALLDAALALGRDPVGRAAFGASAVAYTQEVLSEARALDRFDAWVRGLHASRRVVTS
jgi:colanic acid biosynthesis glycosyl transferase WcaI